MSATPPLQILISFAFAWSFTGMAHGDGTVLPGAAAGLTTPMHSTAAWDTGLFTVPAPRGLVTSRDGVPLAVSRSGERLCLRLMGLAKTEEEAVERLGLMESELAPRIPSLRIPPAEDIAAHYRHRGWLPLPISGVLPETEIADLMENPPPGMALRPVYTRTYPQGGVVAHLTGHAGTSMPDQHGPLGPHESLWPMLEGRAGLERTLEETLRGEAGQVSELYNAEGDLLHRTIARPPRPGLTVVTSLNLAMQEEAARLLARSKRPGALVALDADTGDVLALASYPSFDPNEFVPGISGERYQELADHPEAPFFDRAVAGIYPPGSVFKPVVALAGLDRGSIEGTHTRYDCPPSLLISGREFKNWSGRHEGSMDVRYALARSNNSWFYQAGFDMGASAIGEAARRFALGSPPELPLEAVASGYLPDWEKHSDQRSVANLSIGQGPLLVSPIQMALVMAGLANGEAIPKTRLILRTLDPLTGSVVHENAVAQTPHRYQPEDVALVRAGMYTVVHHEDGTAPRAALSRPRIYGKTGTAQWSVDHKERRLAWFTGWTDTRSPRIAFAVVTEGAVGESVSGGSDAAPIAAAFFRKIYAAPQTFAVTRASSPITPTPDLTGMTGMEELTSVTEDLGEQAPSPAKFGLHLIEAVVPLLPTQAIPAQIRH